MKIKMDKRYTVAEERVKEDMKQFKTAYTDEDLLRAFKDATLPIFGAGYFTGDIITTEVEAFNESDLSTAFAVSMVVMGWNKTHKIEYYTDMNLKVSMNSALINVRTYTAEPTVDYKSWLASIK